MTFKGRKEKDSWKMVRGGKQEGIEM